MLKSSPPANTRNAVAVMGGAAVAGAAVAVAGAAVVAVAAVGAAVAAVAVVGGAAVVGAAVVNAAVVNAVVGVNNSGSGYILFVSTIWVVVAEGSCYCSMVPCAMLSAFRELFDSDHADDVRR